jgi:anti-anti-sigma factor
MTLLPDDIPTLIYDLTAPGPADPHGKDAPVAVHHLGGIAVVAAHGDLDDAVGDALRAALAEAVAAGGHVVVDLARVDHIRPRALGLLVRAHREARRGGSVLAVAAASRFVLTVLHTMRLHRVFPLFADRDEAVSRLGATRADGHRTAHRQHLPVTQRNRAAGDPDAAEVSGPGSARPHHRPAASAGGPGRRR